MEKEIEITLRDLRYHVMLGHLEEAKILLDALKEINYLIQTKCKEEK